jgi:hypothetical protein
MEEDNFMKEELPANDKVLAKYEYEGKPNVQDDINMRDVHKVPPKEELPADNEVVAKYKCEEVPEVPDMPADNEVLTEYMYSHSRSTITRQTETLDVAKMRYQAEPTDLEREEPTVRENPYSINESHQEGDIADHEQNNGVATKKESRGSP